MKRCNNEKQRALFRGLKLRLSIPNFPSVHSPFVLFELLLCVLALTFANWRDKALLENHLHHTLVGQHKKWDSGLSFLFAEFRD